MKWLVGGIVAVLVAWLAPVLALIVARPRGGLLKEAIRIFPDTLRLLKDLAADPTLPRGVRARLWFALAYLAMPFDLVPDFIPVLGFADDAIVVALALRSVVRRAGRDAVRRHWRGTPEGLHALARVAGLRLDGTA